MSIFGNNPMAGFGAPPEIDTETEFSARRGAPLPAGTPVASHEEVVEALKAVYDPEIPVNIYDLGLIYSLEIEPDGSAVIEMSLTAPGCPVAGEMPGMVSDAAASVEGIGEVETRLIWDPPWSPDLMSENAKLALGML